MRFVFAPVLSSVVKKDSQHHFTHCERCGEWFDRRDKSTALKHLVHQGVPGNALAPGKKGKFPGSLVCRQPFHVSNISNRIG
jgi:hypothetical protein